MRTLEWLMVVLSIPAVGWTLISARPWPAWLRTLTIVDLLLLPLHAWVEGAHWQMIPIYFGMLLLLVPLLLRPPSRSLNESLNRLAPRPKLPSFAASLSALLLLTGLAFCYTLPMFKLPAPTGPYPIATQTLRFTDADRMEEHPHTPHGNRQVVVQIWYPSATTTGIHARYRLWKEADLRSTYQTQIRTVALQDAPAASGKFPVILFNHAWRGFRNRSSFIMQELASHGFVVIGVAHPYNAALVELAGGKIADGRNQQDLGDFYSKPTLTLEQREALAANEMRIQTADDKFLLDQLEKINDSGSNLLAGHMDLTRVGAFGHSFGGSVSVELASEDPRVLSAIVLDGVLHGPVAAIGLPKPLFRIQAETPEMPPGSEFSPVQSTRVHAQLSKNGEAALANSFHTYGGYQVVITGIDHENFSDKGFFSPFHSLSGIGTIPQSRAATIINSYVVAFFLQTLRNQPQPLLQTLRQPFPEVLRFQSWPQHSASSMQEQ